METRKMINTQDGKMEGGIVRIKRNNHKTTFFESLQIHREKSNYTDATLAVEDKFYPVHKLVMSTCSEYFSDVFENTPCKSPVIVLKDIRRIDIEALLDFMYLGEVNVNQNNLVLLLKTGECLKIKGLPVLDEPKESCVHTAIRHDVPGQDLSPPTKRRRHDDSYPISPRSASHVPHPQKITTSLLCLTQSSSMPPHLASNIESYEPQAVKVEIANDKEQDEREDNHKGDASNERYPAGEYRADISMAEQDIEIKVEIEEIDFKDDFQEQEEIFRANNCEDGSGIDVNFDGDYGSLSKTDQVPESTENTSLSEPSLQLTRKQENMDKSLVENINEEEGNQGDEKNEKGSNDKGQGSPLRDKKLEKYLKRWQILYPEVDVQEQISIYQESKINKWQAVYKLRHLNEERKRKPHGARIDLAEDHNISGGGDLYDDVANPEPHSSDSPDIMDRITTNKEFDMQQSKGHYPCGACGKGVGSASIECTGCHKWCHRRCTGLKTLSKAGNNFRCPTCIREDMKENGVLRTGKKENTNTSKRENAEKVLIKNKARNEVDLNRKRSESDDKEDEVNIQEKINIFKENKGKKRQSMEIIEQPNEGWIKDNRINEPADLESSDHEDMYYDDDDDDDDDVSDPDFLPEPRQHDSPDIMEEFSTIRKSVKPTVVQMTKTDEQNCIPRKLAVCIHCGILSEDLIHCQRCKTQLPTNVRTLPAASTTTNKTVNMGAGRCNVFANSLIKQQGERTRDKGDSSRSSPENDSDDAITSQLAHGAKESDIERHCIFTEKQTPACPSKRAEHWEYAKMKLILPNMTDHEMDSLVNHLIHEHGLSSMKELHKVQGNDLQRFLKIIPYRKLVHAFKPTVEELWEYAKIKQVLPDIEDHALNELVYHLTKVDGCSGMNELHKVQQNDIQYILKPIPYRALVRAFKLKGNFGLEYAKIKQVLPDMEDCELDELVNHLIKVHGISAMSELHRIKENELKEFLMPVQYRALVFAFNLKVKTYEIQAQQQDISKNPGSAEVSHATNVNLLTSPSSVSLKLHLGPSLNVFSQSKPKWEENFEVHWNELPTSVLRAVCEGKRPETSIRREFVRFVIDEIRKHCLNPTRPQCEVVALSIIQMHPKCFADLTEDGELIGKGHHSLLSQLKGRIDHLNRNTPEVKRRKPRTNPGPKYSENLDTEYPNSKRYRSQADTYGCVSWQPIGLPDGENEDTLEAKRLQMVKLFHQKGYNDTDESQIDELMILTYPAQRRTINSDPAIPINTIVSQWPFLSLQQYMCVHFKELTKIDLYRHLQDTMGKKSKRIFQYFLGQPSKPRTWKVLDEIFTAYKEDVEAPGAILLVMSQFFEKTDSIFLLADAAATKEDIEKSLVLPQSPRLIVQGNSILCGVKWMLSIEGKVICELKSPHSNFVAGLALLFASYYIFNYQYETGAEMTLEFIQRYLVGINPDTGTKCSSTISNKSGKTVFRKRNAINTHVLNLLNRIAAYSEKHEVSTI